MKSLSPLGLSRAACLPAHLLAGFIASHPALAQPAQNTANNFTGGETGSLLVIGNWSLGALPLVTHDAVFTVTPGIKSLTSGDLIVGSFNVTATTGTFSIRNETSTATNRNLTLGGAGNFGNSVSGTAADLLYAATGSTFNIRGDNGGSPGGTGVLRLVLGQSGNFNIAGTCNISSVIDDNENHHGITKTGVGTLTLSGVNTYRGDTTVSNGTLVLAENAGMKFVVTNDSNNHLGGTGTATLNGVFSIDTAAVTNTSGWWTLVDVTTLTESFGSNFSVVTTVGGVNETWQKSSHVWTRNESGKTWTFTEATGVLALTGGSAYDSWATTAPNNLHGGDAAFDVDYDKDGIANGLEWILGGDPTRNDTPSILPVVGGSASNGLTLEFRRAGSSVAGTILMVEWGCDPGNLSNIITIGTTDINVPALGDDPSVYMNTPSPGMVTVHIPAANAPGGKLFARLRATRD